MNKSAPLGVYGFVMRTSSSISYKVLIVSAAAVWLGPSLHGQEATENWASEEALSVSGRLLEQGGDAFGADDFDAAESAWLEVVGLHPGTPEWPKAVFNLGLLERRRGRPARAVQYFEDLLAAKPNDREPGENLMEAYRNYSNRAASEISVCYESMGRYRDALRFAWLAKYEYPFQSWCGTCLASAEYEASKRIAWLAARAYALQGGLTLACVVFGGLFWRRRTTRGEF